jgi:uncharacterized protein
MPAFAFKLDDIDEAGSSFAFPLDASWLKGALEGSDLRVDPSARAASLEANAHKSGREDIVRSLIRAGLLVPCARCLEDVTVPVDLDVSTVFRPALEARDEAEVDLDEEGDSDVDYYQAELVVLDGVVREHLLLEEPMQPLCREDCPGIDIPAHLRAPASLDAADSGDVDPRLAPLMKLRRNIAPTEE